MGGCYDSTGTSPLLPFFTCQHHPKRIRDQKQKSPSFLSARHPRTPFKTINLRCVLSNCQSYIFIDNTWTTQHPPSVLLLYGPRRGILCGRGGGKNKCVGRRRGSVGVSYPIQLTLPRQTAKNNAKRGAKLAPCIFPGLFLCSGVIGLSVRSTNHFSLKYAWHPHYRNDQVQTHMSTAPNTVARPALLSIALLFLPYGNVVVAYQLRH